MSVKSDPAGKTGGDAQEKAARMSDERAGTTGKMTESSGTGAAEAAAEGTGAEMPEEEKTETKNKETKKTDWETPFIREKIVKRKKSAGQRIVRLLGLIFCAALFGVVALIAASLARPYVSRYLGLPEYAVQETVRIGRDEPPGSAGQQDGAGQADPSAVPLEQEASEQSYGPGQETGGEPYGQGEPGSEAYGQETYVQEASGSEASGAAAATGEESGSAEIRTAGGAAPEGTPAESEMSGDAALAGTSGGSGNADAAGSAVTGENETGENGTGEGGTGNEPGTAAESLAAQNADTESGSAAAAEGGAPSSAAGEGTSSAAASENADFTPEELRRIRLIAEDAAGDAVRKNAPSPGITELIALSDRLRLVSDKADLSVAEVHAVQESKDLFDNRLRSSGSFSGVAVAKTGGELLLLTTDAAVEDAEALTVNFRAGAPMEASVKRVDRFSGLAVLSVPITDETEGTISRIDPVALGNSYLLKRGDVIIAGGAPFGVVHSVSYGFVSFLTRSVSVTDSSASVFYTDASGNAGSGTWVFNTSGELVGWVTGLFRERSTDPVVFLGISEHKSLLEHMMNAQASPHIGVKGTAVPEELRKQGVPGGVYVTEVGQDSPAYRAGIQPGDIIIRFGDSDVRSIRDYAMYLEKLHAEDDIRVTVMRNGREEYKELEFVVTVGAR